MAEGGREGGREVCSQAVLGGVRSAARHGGCVVVVKGDGEHGWEGEGKLDLRSLPPG